jgi:hypothetical protein
MLSGDGNHKMTDLEHWLPACCEGNFVGRFANSMSMEQNSWMLAGKITSEHSTIKFLQMPRHF